ncbi:MAG: hypothetical protein IJE43_25110 [Alphaproteobacteria bacterium]|nr:hypothetical protein [Alphaproteobacteria bacterium]MBQ6849547.1 hypothetical protein [Oscillospiraceae bacterium]
MNKKISSIITFFLLLSFFSISAFAATENSPVVSPSAPASDIAVPYGRPENARYFTSFVAADDDGNNLNLNVYSDQPTAYDVINVYRATWDSTQKFYTYSENGISTLRCQAAQNYCLGTSSSIDNNFFVYLLPPDERTYCEIMASAVGSSNDEWYHFGLSGRGYFYPISYGNGARIKVAYFPSNLDRRIWILNDGPGTF